MKNPIRILRHNGVLKIDIDGTLYDPLSFKSFRANAQNISEFYAAGVRLFSVLIGGLTCALGVPYSLFGDTWVGDDRYDFAPLDAQMDLFIQNAPDAYFAPMLQLDTRDWYLQAHPEAVNSFTHLSWAAFDEAWKRAAADYLKAAIRHCEKKYGDRIYGYFILGGMTTEWLAHPDKEASHPLKEKGYRAFCKDENAKLPTIEELNRADGAFLGKDEKNVYTARRFHAETVADLLLCFAGEAQSVLQHKKLLGCYFGYLLHLGGEYLYNAGHLAYEKVFLSPDIDMISSPSCYRYRKLGDPSAFMLTQKTLDAHNKLYFLEFDHITHAAPEEIVDGREDDADNRRLVKIPGADSKCKNETESLNLMLRDYILCRANGTALWWFDMFDGWFRSDSMMQTITKMVDLTKRLSMLSGDRRRDIAVIAEGESMYRARKASRLASKSLSDVKRALSECGCCYDLYSVCDLSLPQIEDYKLILFLNQYEITDNTKALVQRLLDRGKSVVWLYAPDYANGGDCDAKRIAACTGIKVTESNTPHGGMVVDGTVTTYEFMAPYFAVNDEKADTLAVFEDGAVAAAAKKASNGRSVYVATPDLPSALLRTVAEQAGAFVYSRDPLVYTYPTEVFVGVYNATAGDATVYLPEDGVYRDLIENGAYKCQNGKLCLPPKPIRAYLLIKE